MITSSVRVKSSKDQDSFFGVRASGYAKMDDAYMRLDRKNTLTFEDIFGEQRITIKEARAVYFSGIADSEAMISLDKYGFEVTFLTPIE